MKINLLLHKANQSWIINKLAERLGEELVKAGIDVSITEKPDPGADIVHHMSWAFANLNTTQPSTMFITHLDDRYKVDQVFSTLKKDVRVGVCMSSDTMNQLLERGCEQSSVYYINPAHDGVISSKKIIIGITSRVYPDGRKREYLLKDLSKRMNLTNFHFRIFGRGWNPTIKLLIAAGASVEYFDESDDYRTDYDVLVAAVPTFDYYLYLGLDEGSLGILDALSAGVATIVTPQGFHIDLPNGVTHSVLTIEDLERVFRLIEEPLIMRRFSVQKLTWQLYARRHIDLWASILDNRELPRLPNNNFHWESEYILAKKLMQLNVNSNVFNLRRLLSAISHWPHLQSIRRFIEKTFNR